MLSIQKNLKTLFAKIGIAATVRGIAGAGFVVVCLCTSAWAKPEASAASCANLARLDIPEATVTMAEVVQPMGFKIPAKTERPANGGPGGPGGPGGGPGGPGGGPGGPGGGPGGPGGGGMSLAPFDPKDTTNHVPFCRVAATLKPSGDSDIKIEVWLPLQNWNGKMMGAGDFGWAGSIMYGGLLIGLEHNFAVVSTDTGHDNSLSSGAFSQGHPDKIIDYGYRAAHSMTVDAKVFIKAFYGESPKHAYWWGCSLGGQMGLTEINRFPEDYDAAIIGAPASPIVELNFWQIWPAQLVVQNPARALSRDKATMLHEAVMNACDALDGAKDGEIEDPTACHFDPATLLCKGEDNASCLTAPQVEYVKLMYTGPVNPSTGEKIFEGAEPGMEGTFANSGNAGDIATALYKYLIFQNPNWDWKTLDFKDVDYGRAVLRTINEDSPANSNLKPFFDRGGKVLWYHGWVDGASVTESVHYIDALKEKIGASAVENHVRLFAMPGMGHCSGGAGCDTFDKLAELDRWVETGTAPERIVASKKSGGKVIRTHPLCAWPEVAKYKGTGDVNDAANFDCVKK